MPTKLSQEVHHSGLSQVAFEFPLGSSLAGYFPTVTECVLNLNPDCNNTLSENIGSCHHPLADLISSDVGA